MDRWDDVSSTTIHTNQMQDTENTVSFMSPSTYAVELMVMITD